MEFGPYINSFALVTQKHEVHLVMQGTPVHAGSMLATRLSFQKQPNTSQAERLTLTLRQPNESLAQLKNRANLQTDAVFLRAQTPKIRRFTSLAEKHGKDLVLRDFSLKPTGLLNRFPHLAKPVRIRDIQPGQILIHRRTGRAVKVMQVLTTQFNSANKRTNVQGKLVKNAAGQVRLKPTRVRTGYLFQFKGVVLSPKAGSPARGV